MNKTDNIFRNGGGEQRKVRKDKKREKSFVLEFKELKREVDQEIKREI